MHGSAAHRPTRVFICYAHESDEHKRSVQALAAFLRQKCGVDADLDAWNQDRRRDWGGWAVERIEDADYVLVIASPRCRLVGDGRGRAGENRGLRFELGVLRNLIQGRPDVWESRVLPVILPGFTPDDIPLSLLPYTMDHYKIHEFTLDGADTLVRELTGRPRDVRPALGTPPVLSPQPLNTPDSRRLPIVNRDTEQTQLMQALTGDGPNIVVVNGPAGVGKSRLVDKVLDELGRTSPPPRICRHPLGPTESFVVKTIIDDIGADAPPGGVVNRNASMLGSLELALETHGSSRVLIVVDPAERLLEPNTGRVIGLDLNEAFEVVRHAPHSRVKILLVTQKPLVPTHETDWVSGARSIPVTGLELIDFTKFLEALRGTASELLVPRAALPEVNRHLGGNPRLTELVHALVHWYGGLRPDRLVEELAAIDPAALGGALVTRLVDNLPPKKRLVLEALAAFGTFVTAGTVYALVKDHLTTAEVDDALRLLADRHVIRRANAWYGVPDPDAAQVLERRLEPDRLERLRRAAAVLHDLRTDDDRVQNAADLRTHFEELDVLLRAREYGQAFDAVRTIDRFLRQWNCPDLLLEQRRCLRGKLGHGDRELSNHNALGYACAARGWYPQAAEAFEEALLLLLDHADDDDESTGQKLLINLANLRMEQNHTWSAAGLYRDVLRDEVVDIEDRAVAFSGLADCHRRWGDYDAAVALSTRALEDARAVRSLLTAGIALKLARWSCELMRLDDADELLAEAEAAVARRADYALWTPACHDGRADLHLARGRYELAAGVAERAADAAYAQHNAVVVMQARTTMCLAYLHDGNLREAERAIVALERSRRAGRSLIVPALLGLVARRRQNRRKAATFFARLRQEAETRIANDANDFAARDMAGLAICHSLLDNDEPLEPALIAFDTGPDDPARPPGLADRLIFMVDELQRCAPRPDRLRPVIDLLSDQTRR